MAFISRLYYIVSLKLIIFKVRENLEKLSSILVAENKREEA